MFKKFKLVLLSFFALVFAFWLGTGIAYEINPRWFLSDTATEIPENPNAFVAKLARLFRNADRAVVIVKESMRTEESLAGAVDDGPLQSEKDYLALAVRLSRLKEKAKWFHVTEQEHGEEVWLNTISARAVWLRFRFCNARRKRLLMPNICIGTIVRFL